MSPWGQEFRTLQLHAGFWRGANHAIRKVRTVRCSVPFFHRSGERATWTLRLTAARSAGTGSAPKLGARQAVVSCTMYENDDRALLTCDDTLGFIEVARSRDSRRFRLGVLGANYKAVLLGCTQDAVRAACGRGELAHTRDHLNAFRIPCSAVAAAARLRARDGHLSDGNS